MQQIIVVIQKGESIKNTLAIVAGNITCLLYPPSGELKKFEP